MENWLDLYIKIKGLLICEHIRIGFLTFLGIAHVRRITYECIKSG